MEKNSIDQKPSEDDIYLQKFPKGKFLGGIIFFFFAFLVVNLPLSKNIKRVVSQALNSNPRCPMEFRDLEVGFFLPKIDIHDLKFVGSCNGMNLSTLNLKKVRATFLGPSFSPIGVKIKVHTSGHGLNLNIYANVSPSKAAKIKIENTGVNTDLLGQIMGKPLPITGRLLIDGLIDGKVSKQKFKPTSISAKITSPNLLMPKQNISMLDLPQLLLGPAIVSIKTVGTARKQKIKILQFVVGNKQSDLEIELGGDITPNFDFMSQSVSALKGKIKLGEKVTEIIPMSLLNTMVFKGAQPKKGFYQFNLNGPLKNSRPKFY